MRVRLCVIMRVYSWAEVQRTRYYKAAIFRGNAVWFSKQICVWRNTKFSAGMDFRELGVTCSRRSSAEQVAVKIEIDSGWKHVCFGFSVYDLVIVCFGFSGHMRGKQIGLHGITVA